MQEWAQVVDSQRVAEQTMSLEGQTTCSKWLTKSRIAVVTLIDLSPAMRKFCTTPTQPGKIGAVAGYRGIKPWCSTSIATGRGSSGADRASACKVYQSSSINDKRSIALGVVISVRRAMNR